MELRYEVELAAGARRGDRLLEAAAKIDEPGTPNLGDGYRDATEE